MEKKSSLVSGDVGKALIKFSAPIIFSNLIQAIYGLVDMMVVGHFVGSTGMTAVSMGAQITNVVMMVANGLANGGSVMAAQMTGRGENKEIPKIFGTLLTFFLFAAVALSIALIGFARPLLLLINTPTEALSQAVTYLVICLAGTLFVYSYNCMAALLRGLGNSKVPMVIIIITVALNAVLDLLFIGVFSIGAAGAALATILCQMTSTILVVLYVRNKAGLFSFRLSSFRICKQYLALSVKIGLPQSIQSFFASTSHLFLSSLVNLYGVSAAAAAGAAGKIQTLAALPSQGMMSGLMILTAQNLAIDQPKRVMQGMRSGMLFSFSISAVIFALCMAFPGTAFRIFTPEPEVAAIGIGFLRRIIGAFLLESFMFCMFGVIAGSGYTPMTMCCGVLSAFAVRYGCAWLFSQIFHWGFNGIGIAYLAGPVVSSTICILFLLSGKWKSPRVRVS